MRSSAPVGGTPESSVAPLASFPKSTSAWNPPMPPDASAAPRCLSRHQAGLLAGVETAAIAGVEGVAARRQGLVGAEGEVEEGGGGRAGAAGLGRARGRERREVGVR